MAFGGDTAEAFYDEGLTCAMRGEVRKAIELFKEAILRDSTLAAAYHQLGKCYLRLGQYKAAVTLIEQVIQKKPRNMPARIDLGHAYLELGFLDRARDQFSTVSNHQPNNARATLGLAKVAFLEGKWEDAMKMAQLAAGQSGPNFSALYLLGRAAHLAQRPDLAIEALEQAGRVIEKTLEDDPNKPEGHYLKAAVAFEQRQFSTALESLQNALARTHKEKVYTAYGESFTYLDVKLKEALCYMRLGRDDRAKDIAKEVLAVTPDNKLAQSLIEEK